LDQPWTSNNEYINSSKSFMFSTTAKVKANIISQQYESYGALGHPNLGPSFGGCDLMLVLTNNNDKSPMTPHSYIGTDKIIGAKDYPGSDQSSFKPLEVKVYTLD